MFISFWVKEKYNSLDNSQLSTPSPATVWQKIIKYVPINWRYISIVTHRHPHTGTSIPRMPMESIPSSLVSTCFSHAMRAGSASLFSCESAVAGSGRVRPSVPLPWMWSIGACQIRNQHLISQTLRRRGSGLVGVELLLPFLLVDGALRLARMPSSGVSRRLKINAPTAASKLVTDSSSSHNTCFSTQLRSSPVDNCWLQIRRYCISSSLLSGKVPGQFPFVDIGTVPKVVAAGGRYWPRRTCGKAVASKTYRWSVSINWGVLSVATWLKVTLTCKGYPVSCQLILGRKGSLESCSQIPIWKFSYYLSAEAKRLDSHLVMLGSGIVYQPALYDHTRLGVSGILFYIVCKERSRHTCQ